MPPQLVDQLKIAAQIVALKARHVAPSIARTQRPDIGNFALSLTLSYKSLSGDQA